MNLKKVCIGLFAFISSTAFASTVDEFANMIKIPLLPEQRALYFAPSCPFSITNQGQLDLGEGIKAQGINLEIEKREPVGSGGEVTLDSQWIPITQGTVQISGQTYTNEVQVTSSDNGVFLEAKTFGFRKTGWFEKDRLVLYSVELQLSKDLGHVIEVRASTSSKALGDDQEQWVGEKSFICD